MRILILGASGMMGHMAARVLGERHDVYGTTRSIARRDAPLAHFLPGDHWIGGVDSARMDTIAAALAKVRPDAVLNCIGIVKQLAEAKDPLLSLEVNSVLPHRLSLLCQAAGARLVHMSTDCVFSGHKGAYSLDDVPDPVDLYGRTKLLGETPDGPALTIRTSIVGRQIAGRTGLFEWILSSRGRTVRGFRRAIYTGLTTMALARIIGTVLVDHQGLEGVWQVASAPITKLDLMARLNELLGLGIDIQPDDTFHCDRSLDGSRFLETTGIRVPSWDQMLEEFAADQTSYEWLDRSGGE